MKIILLSIQHRLPQISRLCFLTLAILCAELAGMGGISPTVTQAHTSQINSMDGLLMYLSLDEFAGSCSFMDWSGNGHNGSVPTGTCPSAGQAGHFYGAVAFDGVYNNIQVANSSSLEFGNTQDFTVLLWMKSDSLRSWDALISTKQWWGGTLNGYILSIDSSGNKWMANAADGTNRADAYSSGAVLSDNQWHHLAVTFDRDGQMVMYQDGTQVGSVSMVGIGSINSGYPIVMGNTYAEEEPYAGLLDDVMIYDRVLTPTEIAGLMQGDCTVSDGGDSGENTLRGKLADNTCHTISFDNDYTITLTQQLSNGRAVTVDGSGHNIVISANNNSRVLDNTGSDVTLINLTLRDGRLNSCSSYADNAGAGIFQHGYTNTYNETLTLINCTIANNHNDTCYGGGIFNGSVVVKLVNSTVNDNYAFWGAGIFDFGAHTTINNSTLANNHASGIGGAIATTSSTITIDNSTLVNNRADGNDGDGGGAISNRNEENVVVIRNSILAGSPAGGNCKGYAFSSGTTNNLADDGTCGSGFTNSGSISLGALGNYGGSTATFPLQSGSPAIDSGDAATCLSTDQRGEARNDLRCDIGAYELKYSDSDTVWLSPSSSVITTYGPALAGVSYDSSYSNPGVTTIYKSTSWKNQGPESINSWWVITPTTTSGISTTLKLCYTDAESNSLSLATLRFWRYHEGAWNQLGDVPATSTDSNGNHCAQISGVDSFSTWTLATGEPTAVHVNHLAARSGHDPWSICALGGLLALGSVFVWRKRRAC